jgi:hypothetical protein
VAGARVVGGGGASGGGSRVDAVSREFVAVGPGAVACERARADCGAALVEDRARGVFPHRGTLCTDGGAGEGVLADGDALLVQHGARAALVHDRARGHLHSSSAHTMVSFALACRSVLL